MPESWVRRETGDGAAPVFPGGRGGSTRRSIAPRGRRNRAVRVSPITTDARSGACTWRRSARRPWSRLTSGYLLGFQLFRDVLGVKTVSCGATFSLPQLGHLTFTLARSARVSVAFEKAGRP